MVFGLIVIHIYSKMLRGKLDILRFAVVTWSYIFIGLLSKQLYVECNPDQYWCNNGTYWTVACCGSTSGCNLSDGPPRVVLMTAPLLVITDGSIIWINGDRQPRLCIFQCGTSANNARLSSFNLTLSPIPGHDDEVCETTILNFYTANDVPGDQTGDWFVQGGNGHLSWTYSDYHGMPISSGSVRFQILGRNYEPGELMERLWSLPNRSAVQLGRAGDYFPYMAGAESSFKHFLPNGRIHIKYEKNGRRGYGLYQLTEPKPTCRHIWGVTLNAIAGRELLAKKVKQAAIFMAKQRRQTVSDMGFDVPVPDRPEGNCFFQDWNIEAAVAIKQYNGAEHNYCSWTRPNASLGIKGEWHFSPLSQLSDGETVNYVYNVCSYMPKENYPTTTTTAATTTTTTSLPLHATNYDRKHCGDYRYGYIRVKIAIAPLKICSITVILVGFFSVPDFCS